MPINILLSSQYLSIAYCNKEKDLTKAMDAMKKALDPAYPRLHSDSRKRRFFTLCQSS